MDVFRREIGGKLKSPDIEGESRCWYSLHDFSLAIMEMPKKLVSAAIDIVLKSKELEVNSTLIPNEAELEEVYWKELTLIIEEDETTSAFDGATENIAYVPKYEPNGGLENEAGFDDVTDVPTAERKIELPKEDPKLEEEVRGKNVGENELENEAVFDDVIDMLAAERSVEALEEDLKLEGE
ncbi:Hypothetical predicted protein [Olea europaea subsp. europaea]|uniref:Uncharacterized protein n=1 Tax=Olea europaea subsp. europaea TaxID=158383 RepID=A0A8S0T7B5_OLEEU|nr:Hypothetical predicted protein [Olea europaea subsp. europaea]